LQVLWPRRQPETVCGQPHAQNASWDQAASASRCGGWSAESSTPGRASSGGRTGAGADAAAGIGVVERPPWPPETTPQESAKGARAARARPYGRIVGILVGSRMV